MNINHNLKDQFASVGRANETSTDKSIVRRELKFAERIFCSLQGPRGPERKNFNGIFADFLVSTCTGNDKYQYESWNLLTRKAMSVARKLGIVRCSASIDYEQVALDCMLKEVQKHASLKVDEIAHRRDDYKFAYIRKALMADYIDEIRKSRRRPELAVDWDDFWSGKLMLESGREAPAHQNLDNVERHDSHESMAKQLQNAAINLPLGPAAISGALADLFGSFEQLREFADPELSDTECKSRFVEHVAKRRGVGEQVVRKDVKRFKDNVDRPEYARVFEILKSNLNSLSRCAPKITAPAAPKSRPCPLPEEFQGQPVWVDADAYSIFWPPKCVVCNTGLHNEGDYCSVCLPGDEERKFQPFQNTSNVSLIQQTQEISIDDTGPSFC